MVEHRPSDSLGLRSLPRRGSLVQLLMAERGVRSNRFPPRLTVALILKWADDHMRRTGAWPSSVSGSVHGVIGECWRNINRALTAGNRGLPGGSSVAQLLSVHRSKRNRKRLPPLTIKQILSWADAHRTATGR